MEEEKISKIICLSNQALSNKNLTSNLKSMLYTTFIGFIDYYGVDYLELIYDAYLDTNFKIVDEFTKEEQEHNKLSNQSRFVTPALLTEDLNIEKDKITITDTISVKKNFSEDTYLFLMYLTHELNHVINSLNKRVKQENNLLTVRNGISTIDIDVEKGTTKYNDILIGEGFNQLQTLDIMKHILKLCDNKNINPDLLSVLKNIEDKKDNPPPNRSYKDIVEILTPLYCNKEFSSLYKISSLDGNVSTIKQNFNRLVGTNKFELLSTTIDECYDSDHTWSSYLESKSLVKKYVKKQDKSV